MTSREVQEAVGVDGETLDARRERLRQAVATPTERERAQDELAQVERAIAARDAASLKAEAERRLLGILRAHESLAAQIEQDDARLLDAAREFAGRMATLNERFDKLALLRHEAAALGEAFGLTGPALSPVLLPGKRVAVREALEVAGSTPIRDTGFVQEERVNGVRSYGELGDAPGRHLLLRKLASKSPRVPSPVQLADDGARIGT